VCQRTILSYYESKLTENVFFKQNPAWKELIYDGIISAQYGWQFHRNI